MNATKRTAKLRRLRLAVLQRERARGVPVARAYGTMTALIEKTQQTSGRQFRRVCALFGA